MQNQIKGKNIVFWIKMCSAIFLFLFIIIYSFIQMREVIYGVNVDARIESFVKETQISKITGKAKNATYLSLNGREISIDKDGTFKEDIALPIGYSVITLRVKDKFGKTLEKTMEVYTEGNDAVAFQINSRSL